MIKYVACITNYTDGQSDDPVRITLIVSDISRGDSPIIFTREWLDIDYELNDMYDELDLVIGDLSTKYPNLTKIHVRGLCPLQRNIDGLYYSRYVTKENFKQMLKDNPEQF